MDESSDVDAVERVMNDLTCRAPFGVVWEASAAKRPVEVAISPADHPRMIVVLAADLEMSAATAAFAAEVQERLTPLFAGRVRSGHDEAATISWLPACPLHEHALLAEAGGTGPLWVCPAGGWSCSIGGFEDSFWPFGTDADPKDVLRAVHRRLRMAGVTYGGSSHLNREGIRWVLAIRLRSRDDSPQRWAALVAAMSDAITPVRLAIETVVALRTFRHRVEPEIGPPFRPGGDRLASTGWQQLALLHGVLRRPDDDEECDVVVETSPGHRIRVRFRFDHRITPTGSPFLLDHEGAPFADEGDVIALGGGSSRVGRVTGAPSMFDAGSIERFDDQPK